MKTLRLDRCPACGDGAHRTFDLGAGNLLKRCSNCGTVSALQYADPEEVFKPGYLQGGAGSFGIDVRDPLFQDYLARIARRRMAMIEAATGMRSGSMLDVGCGTGEVMQAAQERGWSVVGVEPEATSAQMARERGLDVQTALLEESGLPERSFDVVSAFHVLEHIADSRGFLNSVKRWVRPGGAVVIEVPNFASVQRRRRGHEWVHLRPLEHLVHFTPGTLARTMRSAGIDPVVVRSPEYLSPPQTMEHALGSMGRHGRFAKLASHFSEAATQDGDRVRVPSRLGWALLRAMEAAHDRVGAGAVVFCAGYPLAA